MTFYRIRSKTSGLYRSSGSYPTWTKNGKFYDSLGKLRQAISNCMTYNGRASNPIKNNFSDWDIVEYDMVETKISGVHEVIKPEKLVKLLSK